MGDHVSPYRIAPARAPRRKRSALRRIWAAARFPPPPDIASFRPTFMVIQTIAAICAYLAGWYLFSAILGASVALVTSPTFDVLRVLWRLRRARKTMRVWSTRCLHRDDGCHTCGGACDPTMTDWCGIPGCDVCRIERGWRAHAEAQAKARRALRVAGEVSEMLRERKGCGR